MSTLCKYYKEKKQVSYDCETWQDVTPPEYRKGGLYESDSSDCYYGVPLTIVPRTDGAFIFDTIRSDQIDNGYFYSYDGINWVLKESGGCVKMTAGRKIYLKGNLYGESPYDYGIGTIRSIYGYFDVEGNLSSIIGRDDKDNPHVKHLFDGCRGLVSAKGLIIPPITNNSAPIGGYSYMFSGCTSLIEAPSLPNSPSIYEMVFRGMFQGCTSLTTSPVLQYTGLTEYCYADMFSGCTSLNKITCLATNRPHTSSTENWVVNVAPTGTFIAAPSTTWPYGVNGVPNGWTIEYAN